MLWIDNFHSNSLFARFGRISFLNNNVENIARLIRVNYNNIRFFLLISILDFDYALYFFDNTLSRISQSALLIE